MTTPELYLKTIFCCMACDGNVAPQEVAMIRKMSNGNELFGALSVETTINSYVEGINKNGVKFLNDYLKNLSETTLSDEEQLTIVKLAVQTIEADNKIEYSEVKFFKKIRNCLSLTDEQILEQHPEKEDWLLPDINVEDELVWDDVEFENIDLSAYEQK